MPVTAPFMTSKRRNDTIQTPQKSTPQTCPTSTCSAQDFLAKAGPLVATDLGSLTPEALSSLKLPDWLKPNALRICCLKMFPEFYCMTRGKRLQPSSPRFMSWGMVSNGLCLTAPLLESRRCESGFSLSAILIPDAPEKYFLSSEQTQKLLYKSLAAHKAPVSTTPAE